MRVFILAHNLSGAGAWVVGTNFIRALRDVAPQHEYFAVYPAGVGYEDIVLPEGSCGYAYAEGRSLFRRWRFDCLTLPKMIREFNPDVILALGNIGVTMPEYPQAILFHQPQLVYPKRYWGNITVGWNVRAWLLRRRLKACLKTTQIVFCQTPVARERFATSFGYPVEQIRLMPNAVSEFAKVSPEQAGVPAMFSDRKYFSLFCLTKYYPHKNIEILVEMFRQSRDRLQDVRCIITVAGNHGPGAKELLRKIDHYGLREHIVNVGPLKPQELAGYFLNADALIFPTLLESFSGTYLEAMHFGLPILTSDIDFAHYICGDAAVYFDPWNPRDIADKIVKIRDDSVLRQQLIQRGGERIGMFFKSWSAIVTEAISEIQRLAVSR